MLQMLDGSVYMIVYMEQILYLQKSQLVKDMILRGAKVIEYTKNFLDENFKLKNSKWNVNKILIKNIIKFVFKGKNTELENDEKYVGYRH